MLEDTLKQIKRDCTAAMNGAISQSMRDYGLDYKLNFGLRLIQIKNIAEKYGKSKELAEKLWAEKTRELIILATLIYPVDQFSVETAESWVSSIGNQEIREQVCLNLFQELPFAKEMALEWAKSEDQNIKITGYWLLARLLLSKKIMRLELAELPTSYLSDLASGDLFLRNSANLVGKFYVRISTEKAKEFLSFIECYKTSDNKIQVEVYDSISFEAEFLWG